MWGVTQARVSRIENGAVSGIEVVRAYVTALGGTAELVAILGDRTWKVACPQSASADIRERGSQSP